MAGEGRQSADEVLALAVAGGKTIIEAAAQAGVSERTARRRMRQPAFRARVEELRRQLIEDAAARLAGALVEAAEAMRALLGAESESVRLAASRSVFEFALKVREQVSIEERLRALEEARGTSV